MSSGRIMMELEGTSGQQESKTSAVNNVTTDLSSEDSVSANESASGQQKKRKSPEVLLRNKQSAVRYRKRKKDEFIHVQKQNVQLTEENAELKATQQLLVDENLLLAAENRGLKPSTAHIIERQQLNTQIASLERTVRRQEAHIQNLTEQLAYSNEQVHSALSYIGSMFFARGADNHDYGQGPELLYLDSPSPLPSPLSPAHSLPPLSPVAMRLV